MESCMSKSYTLPEFSRVANKHTHSHHSNQYNQDIPHNNQGTHHKTLGNYIRYL